LKELSRPGVYERLEEISGLMAEGIKAIIRETGLPATLNRVGSLMTLFFTLGPVTEYASARRSDLEAFAVFHRRLLEDGIYWPPSQFEAAFVSTAHQSGDIRRTLAAVGQAVKPAGGRTSGV
jgi:glutamate-1-semialdehyde 2,1-aminomutase